MVEEPAYPGVFFAQFMKESELEDADKVLNIPSLDLSINVKKEDALEYQMTKIDGSKVFFNGLEFVEMKTFPTWDYGTHGADWHIKYPECSSAQ